MNTGNGMISSNEFGFELTLMSQKQYR